MNKAVEFKDMNLFRAVREVLKVRREGSAEQADLQLKTSPTVATNPSN